MGKLVVAVVVSLVVGGAAGWLLRGRSGSGASGETTTERQLAAQQDEGSAANGTPVEPSPGAGPAPVRTATEPAAASRPEGAGTTAAARDGLPVDPAASGLAARQALRIAALEEDLRRVREELDVARSKSGPSNLPEDGTAAERRAAAARDGNMLVEFPLWGDQLGLSEENVARFGLSDEERAALDRMYSDFYTRTLAELKRLLRELTGDPTAGESSSLNALLHDVLELSPPGACQASMIVALRLLAAGQPLLPPGPDAPPCEVAVYFIFGSVDAMEQAADAMGQSALDALWSGRSTFQFSGRSGEDE